MASYQRALDHGASEPEEVHLNRGVIYADDLRRPDDAARELAKALGLNSRYVPALLNLGTLHEDRGQRDQAEAAYERLLAIDGSHHEALARYAALRVGVGSGDALADRLRRAIGDPATQPADKASLAFALGKMLDACGAYDEAFGAYQLANASSRAGAPGAAPRYDRVAHERLIGRLIDAFPAPAQPCVPMKDVTRTTADSRPTSPPIFICGMFRSGSTLVEQVLAGHSDVTAGGEIAFLPELVRTRLAPYPDSLSQQSFPDLLAMAADYRRHVARLSQGARHVTDKRPENYLHIGLIKTLFPDAKIVHTARSPLDNALSIYFLHLDPSMSYALDLGDIGHHYREYRRLMAHWTALYGDDILDFDYDGFVHEPRPALERLLAFCGLSWQEDCLNFHRLDNAVRTASVWQVRQPLYASSSGRWRHYERHLGPLKAMLQDLPPGREPKD